MQNPKEAELEPEQEVEQSSLQPEAQPTELVPEVQESSPATVVKQTQLVPEVKQTQLVPQVNQTQLVAEIRQASPKSSSDSHSYSRSSSSSSSSRSRSGSKSNSREGSQEKTIRYKYCCKTCKHPEKSKKACVCVVPLSQRRADLGNGCRNCGCSGCSKEDYQRKGEDPEYHPEVDSKMLTVEKVKKAADSKKQQQRRIDRRRDESNSRKRNSPPHRQRMNERDSPSRSPSPEYIDAATMKFYNFDRSMIGSMILNEYQINPIMLGFGIPQRTHSYVFGRPPPS